MKNHLILTGSFIFLLFLTLAEGVSASDGKVVTSTGVAAIANLTPEESQNLALRRARHNAIEKVCGVSVQAETFIDNNMLAAILGRAQLMKMNMRKYSAGMWM